VTRKLAPRFLEARQQVRCRDVYKKKAAAAPMPARAGTMVINGAAFVDCAVGSEVLEAPDWLAPEPEGFCELEAEGLAELEAEDLAELEALEEEAVAEALPAEGVPAAVALGSKLSPAVTTTSTMPK
jgi:hypothetical protein